MAEWTVLIRSSDCVLRSLKFCVWWSCSFFSMRSLSVGRLIFFIQFYFFGYSLFGSVLFLNISFDSEENCVMVWNNFIQSLKKDKRATVQSSATAAIDRRFIIIIINTVFYSLYTIKRSAVDTFLGHGLYIGMYSFIKHTSILIGLIK
jgi:hypothetical protein